MSSRPRIDRNVDLPQPDGPDTATYSPRAMSTVTSSRARVSSSASPLNTRLTCSSRMTGMFGSTGVSAAGLGFARAPPGHIGDLDGTDREKVPAPALPDRHLPGRETTCRGGQPCRGAATLAGKGVTKLLEQGLARFKQAIDISVLSTDQAIDIVASSLIFDPLCERIAIEMSTQKAMNAQ